MELNFRQYSTEGEPLLILHGLFGSLSNWGWQSKKLAATFSVFGLDLRNHGASPHSDQMNYSSMAADVIEFMENQGIEHAHLLGHSMGGKVAMQVALSHPQRISRLAIADIAPVAYEVEEEGEHDIIFEALMSLDLEGLSSRAEADRELASRIDSAPIRQFLLTNLVRQSNGKYAWRMNLPVLEHSYASLRAAPDAEGPYKGPVLFIKGATSNYIMENHRQDIVARFPGADVKTVEGAGHWLHAEKPQIFYKLIVDFLSVDKSL